MNVTAIQLNQFFEDTPEETVDLFVDPLNRTFAKFEIDTPLRIAMFLAQVGHESGGLKFTKENLNYSGDRLLVVFPTHFDGSDDMSTFNRNPEKIANRVYCNRMGNGDEASGDGYKFRGRGLIQITGKNNYTRFAEAIGKDIDDVVEYAETPEGAAMSAGWFWSSNNLNRAADAGDVLAATKLINGGTNGLAQRQIAYNEALDIFVA
jgi:putative chitinase